MRTGGDLADLRRTSMRLGLQTAALVFACLLVVGAVVYFVHSRAEERDARALLADTTAHVDSVSEAPPGVALVLDRGRVRTTSPTLPPGMPDEAALTAVRRSGRARTDEVTAVGHRLVVRTERRGDLLVQAALDRSGSDDERDRVVTALLAAGVVGLVLAGLSATWLTHRAMAPLSRTLTLQRRFVADASHELRTPLTLLSTRVQLLARRMRAEPGAHEWEADFDGVLADTRALTDLLDELLLDADTRPLDRTDVDVRQLCSAAVTSATAEASRRGITISLLPGEEVRVTASTAGLRRAVVALVDNAVGHASSRVDVQVAPIRKHVEISVRDDGAGIPPAVLPHVFERFMGERTFSGGARRHYGLGLALVADIAGQHGGSVEAAEAAGGGAVLTLRLPLRGS